MRDRHSDQDKNDRPVSLVVMNGYDHRTEDARLRRQIRGFKMRYDEDLTPEEHQERVLDLKSRGWIQD